MQYHRNMEIKALIFDLDGTLFNTEELSYKCFIKVAAKHDLTLPKDFFKNITGTTKPKAMAYFKKEVPEMVELYDEVRKLITEKINEYAHIKDSLVKPGFYELMDYLDDHHYLKAIASSSTIEHIRTMLKQLHKEYRFDALISGEMIERSKPSPDIFLKCAEVLKVDIKDCLIIEDSINGIKAARASGAKNIFIEDMIAFNKEESGFVDTKLDSLKDVITYLGIKDI